MICVIGEQKTQEDVEIESSIIKEMMEIVAKRDSLIALLEEDRLRCLNRPRPTTKRPIEHLKFSIFTCLLVFVAYILWSFLVDLCLFVSLN